MQKAGNEVQAAIDRLALALRRAAQNVDTPPRVDFDLSWIDVTTISTKGHSYEPVISITVTRDEIVRLQDL